MKIGSVLLFSILVSMVLWGMPVTAQTPQDLSQKDDILSGGGAFLLGGRSSQQAAIGTAEQWAPRPHLPASALPPGVRRRVPLDYSTIQAAIDASVNGDTVLVSESTYYENLRYRGKAITVASLYAIDGDPSHIPLTIIDGSTPAHPDTGSVVSFIDGEDTTSVLCGFTIRGGTGTIQSGWGVWYRKGGGIFLSNSGGRIMHNTVTRNRVTHPVGSVGGGICASGTLSYLPDVVLEANQIIDNCVQPGQTGTNWSGGGGAGLYGVRARIVGNIFERDSALGSPGAEGGAIDFVAGFPGGPMPGACLCKNIFRSNVVTGTQEGAVGAGVLVGWTADVTISENLFENNIGSSVFGWAQGGGLCVTDQDTTGYGRKVISKNRFLNNHLSHGGASAECGAGIYLFKTLATLDGNLIADNSADGNGGGIGAYRTSFRLENNIVTGNTTPTSAAGLSATYSPQVGTEQVIVNNTIVANQAGYYGGGLSVGGSGANVALLNNIVWGNTALNYAQIYASGTAARVDYCDVQGGWTGVGNINANPAFEAGGFAIGVTSPCIGAGRDTITALPFADYYGHPRPQPVGSQPDIGAIESSQAEPFTNVRCVPQDYATIQAAIDAATPGDLVLVDHGTYLEHILINKTQILVASRYILDADTSHIPLTIIDGSGPHNPDSGSTVTFCSPADTTSVLCGFTVTGGTGTSDSILGVGIRAGGGIFVKAGAWIRHNHIQGNHVVTGPLAAWGGGIEALLDSLDYIIIENNHITDNLDSVTGSAQGSYGGGIDVNGIDPGGGSGRIVGNTISGNTSVTQASTMNAWGGGISLYNADFLVSGNIISRNSARAPNCTAYQSWGGGVMTYTVGLRFLNNRVTDNIVDSPGGGRGGGISVTTESTGGLRDALLSGNYIASNTAVGGIARGGGVYVLDDRPRLENNAILGNRAAYGGAVGVSRINTDGVRAEVEAPGQKARVLQNRVRDQEQILPAPALINNTIAYNRATTGLGGAVWSGGAWSPIVINSIAWGDTCTQEIYLVSSAIGVHYSDIQGGYPGTANINVPPQFAAGEFSLSDTSPCLGTGIDSISLGGLWYVTPDHCMMGSLRPSPSWSAPDMGACESGLASPFARIACAPESFIAGAANGDSSVAMLTIGNYGGTPLNWSIATTPAGTKALSWLSVNPSSGSTPPGGEIQVTVTMRAVLPAGSIQQGSLTISSNDSTSGSRTLPVSLSVLRILSVQIEPAWNMLSVPFVAADYRKAELFPSASSPAYRYLPGSGYATKDTLENSYGYWLRFPTAETRTLAGFPIDADTFAVQAGWNLVGSISLEVPVDSIRSIPGGMVTSPFFGYTPGGYAVTGTILPLRGYWVKVTQAGSLVLAAYPPPLARIQIRPTGELPPPPPGELTGKTAADLPKETALDQNFPNPFNPVTKIQYAIPVGTYGRTSLQVFDLLGREVATLVNEPKEPGVYTVQWDASGVGSGVYFYRLTAGAFTATKRMMLVK
jgi:hypothetical protein